MCFFLYAALVYPNVPLAPRLVASLDGVFNSLGVLTWLGVDGISDPLASRISVSDEVLHKLDSTNGVENIY